MPQALRRLGYMGLIEPLLRKARRRVCELIKNFAPATVLEVGCGACTQAVALALSGLRVTAVDVRAGMFPLWVARLPESLAVLRADGRDLPFPDHAFDLALASLTLHEMAPGDRLPVLGEMRRVVKPGGTLVVMDFDFEQARSRSAAEALIRFIEWGAGREHHAHFLDFIAHGGIPPLAEAAGCSVLRRQPILAGRGGIFELRAGP